VFASEPVYSSLANLLTSSPQTPSIIENAEKSGVDQHPVFLDVELRYGILQVDFKRLRQNNLDVNFMAKSVRLHR
jgi:hypothetical protein